MKALVWGLLVAVCALSVAVALQFNTLAHQRRDGRAASLQTWHTVICYLEGTTLASKKVTAAQKQAAIAFWDHVLSRIDAPTCKL